MMIHTARLLLRPLEFEDTLALATVAGERRIADTTISLPHPFRQEDAKRWIETCLEETLRGTRLGFAMILESTRSFIGYVGLHHIDPEHEEAEISFWISGSYERQGFVTEACEAVIDQAFEALGLNRICAFHMTRNLGSEKVLARLGFHKEGRLRQRVRKWGVHEDVLVWARLRHDPWPTARAV